MNNSLIFALLLGTILMVSLAFGQNDTCPKKTPAYQKDPNAYPSVNQGRYLTMRYYFPLLKMVRDFYFIVLNAVFGFINAFKSVQTVQWQNASDLLFIPAHKAAKMIRKGDLTSTALIQAYIARIQEVNPLLNAVHHDNFANALQLAQAYDSQLAGMSQSDRNALNVTKPLFGVPFTSKDNLMAENFTTSACNMYLMNNPPATQNSPIVQRMKDAGAILLGITAMPNLGLSWAGDDTDCVPNGGTVNNPHDSRRIPGGSSSGEGAIISSAGSLMGIGNDIGGSVRVPSSMNGIFGLKPTNYPNHTVPVEGIVPDFVAYKPAKDMLTNGPLVRYASDLHIVLAVQANQPVDFYYRTVDFANELKLFYLEDLEILICEGLHDEQRDQVRKVKNYFEQQYNLTVQKVEFPLMNRLFELFGLNGWGAAFIQPNEIIPQFWDIYNDVANHTFLDLEFQIMKNFTAPKDEIERAYLTEKLEKFRREVNDLLGQNGLLLLPMLQTPVPFHHMEPFESFNLPYAMTWNLLGNPALAAPTGKSVDTNMPVGVQFVASNFNEALLASIAREMEKAFGGWVQPGKPPVNQAVN